MNFFTPTNGLRRILYDHRKKHSIPPTSTSPSIQVTPTYSIPPSSFERSNSTPLETLSPFPSATPDQHRHPHPHFEYSDDPKRTFSPPTSIPTTSTFQKQHQSPYIYFTPQIPQQQQQKMQQQKPMQLQYESEEQIPETESALQLTDSEPFQSYQSFSASSCKQRFKSANHTTPDEWTSSHEQMQIQSIENRTPDSSEQQQDKRLTRRLYEVPIDNNSSNTNNIVNSFRVSGGSSSSNSNSSKRNSMKSEGKRLSSTIDDQRKKIFIDSIKQQIKAKKVIKEKEDHIESGNLETTPKQESAMKINRVAFSENISRMSISNSNIRSNLSKSQASTPYYHKNPEKYEFSNCIAEDDDEEEEHDFEAQQIEADEYINQSQSEEEEEQNEEHEKGFQVKRYQMIDESTESAEKKTPAQKQIRFQNKQIIRLAKNNDTHGQFDTRYSSFTLSANSSDLSATPESNSFHNHLNQENANITSFKSVESMRLIETKENRGINRRKDVRSNCRSEKNANIGIGNASIIGLNASHVIALIENHANQVGLAAYNSVTGRISLSQVVDRLTYLHTLSTINRFSPMEIIMSSTQADSHLNHILKAEFPKTRITLIKRTLFDETKGEIAFQNTNRKLRLNFDQLYVSLAALNALLTYIEVSQEILLMHERLQIDFVCVSNVLVMDPQTSLDLELLIDQCTLKEERSIMGLFACSTVGGRRLLRSNLLQPLNELLALEQRQQAVLEFTREKQSLIALRSMLKHHFFDFEITAVKFMQRIRDFEHPKHLRSYLLHINKLHNVLKKLSMLSTHINSIQSYTSPIIVHLKQLLIHPDLATLKSAIIQRINPISDEASEASTRANNNLQMLFLVKPEKEGLCEMGRSQCESIQKMANDIFIEYNNLLEAEGENLLELRESEQRGFYLAWKPKQGFHYLSTSSTLKPTTTTSIPPPRTTRSNNSNNNIQNTNSQNQSSLLINVDDEDSTHIQRLESIIGEKIIEVSHEKKSSAGSNAKPNIMSSTSNGPAASSNSTRSLIFSTHTFAELSSRLKATKQQICAETHAKLKELIQLIACHTDILFAVDAAISQLDVCLSFAEFYYVFVSQATPLCMPKLLTSRSTILPTTNLAEEQSSQTNEKTTGQNSRSASTSSLPSSIEFLDISDLYHPLRCSVTSSSTSNNNLSNRSQQPQSATKNSLFISPMSNVQLMVGTQNCGKSTLTKALGIAQILAQIGCYIPASAATLHLRSQILSKFYTVDDLEQSQSGFTAEVNQLNFILQSKQQSRNSFKLQQQNQIIQSNNNKNASTFQSKVHENNLEKANEEISETNDRSLILIDGFCHSSSFEDNIAVGFVFLENIMAAFKNSFIFCSTNRIEFIQLAQVYPNITPLRLNAKYALTPFIEQMKTEQGEQCDNIDHEGIEGTLGLFVCERLLRFLPQIKREGKRIPMNNLKVTHEENKQLTMNVVKHLQQSLKSCRELCRIRI